MIELTILVTPEMLESHLILSLQPNPLYLKTPISGTDSGGESIDYC